MIKIGIQILAMSEIIIFIRTSFPCVILLNHEFTGFSRITCNAVVVFSPKYQYLLSVANRCISKKINMDSKNCVVILCKIV